MNEHDSAELEAALSEMLAVPDADASFVRSLRSRLIEQGKAKPARRFSPRLAWGMALALILVAIGVLAFAPQVVEAMKRLLGYIPGVGYVETGPALRVLSGPVTVERDGLKITIQKGAADAHRTVLLAEIDGYQEELSAAPLCADAPKLESVDGTVQQMVSATATSDGGNAATVFVRYEFEPMPNQALEATLELPCLMADVAHGAWSIPLHFQVAQGTQEVSPVIELPTAIATRVAPTAESLTAAESTPAGFAVVLRTVVELQDGYVLSGNFQWDDASIDRSAVVISDSDIVDARGRDVPFQEVDTDASSAAGPREIPFAYQLLGKDFAWPVSIVVNAISVVQPGQGTFQFDPGPDPRVGQTWSVDIDVPVGEHVIHVLSVRLTGGSPNMPNMLGYEFTMTSDPRVAGATVEDMHPIIDCTGGCGAGGGGGGGGGIDAGPSGTIGASGPFSYGTMAQGYSPAGVKTFVISNMSVFFQGPWQVSWQP